MPKTAGLSRSKRLGAGLLLVILPVAAGFAGCRPKANAPPGIQIVRVPQADAGGPEKLEYIEGTVRGAKPGERIVLYAHSGIWWIQPFANEPFTNILPDGTFRNSTHLGTEYAALLVDAAYQPPTRTSVLPVAGNGVLAEAVANGKQPAAVVKKTLHFSGYDWNVRAAGSDRGGESNAYDTENAWVDGHGFLHLRMADRNGRWSCAEVSLTRSLGYGTYRVVVQDTAHLTPSAVVGIFTWDDIRSEGFRNEVDIELSRWGEPKGKNAQYVIQPFYVPENVSRFITPGGVVAHSFRWEPGNVTFTSVRGAGNNSSASPIGRHVFTSGIPSPASETLHMDFYEFHHTRNPSKQPSEVVIEKFEYLP